MHLFWLRNPNRRQPPCLHAARVVGLGFTATAHGSSPAATVARALRRSVPSERMRYWEIVSASRFVT
jgi:hypothetical protein